MIFGQDRSELRQMYADAWRKRRENLPMSPLEAQIVDVIEMHPEYHAEISGGDIDRDYTPDGGRTNPFLHMGLHLGIREQVSTNRPSGIAGVYRSVAARTGDAHAAEHEMPRGVRLIDSYHCSRYNTQTRRLTEDMFHHVFAEARALLSG